MDFTTALYGTSGNDELFEYHYLRHAKKWWGNDVFFPIDLLMQGGAGNDTLYATPDTEPADAIIAPIDWDGSLLKPFPPEGDEGTFDLFDGGTGIDTANYSQLSHAVTVNLLTGEATSGTDGETYMDGYGLNKIANIENVTGSVLGDKLIGDSNANKIEGGEGNDTVQGNDGNDVLYGEEGDDRIDGGIGNDVILGGDDDDHIWGSFGRDALYGEEGHDVIHGGDGRDAVNG